MTIGSKQGSVFREIRPGGMPLSRRLCSLVALAVAASTLLLAHPVSVAEPGPASGNELAEIRRMERKQDALLRQIKNQLAQLPDDPSPSQDASSEVRERREHKAKLNEMVHEIERRIADEKSRKPPSKEAERVYAEYYQRLRSRIEQEAAKPALGHGDVKPYGSAILKLTIGAAGDLEKLSADQASSPEFARYLESVVRNLAPFEPLSPAMRKHVDRIVISARFSHGAK